MQKLAFTGLLAFIICIIGGCSTHYSTLMPADGGSKTAYLASQEVLLQEIHSAMQTAFSGRNIFPVNEGEIRGYYTWTRVVLDTFTQRVVLIPVEVIDDTGQPVTAYALDVSGSGSSGTGAARNTSFYSSLKQTLDNRYQVVVIE